MAMNDFGNSKMSNDTSPRLRIAVVGCGAVTENFHLPVLAGHDGVVISALVDPNTTRAEKLAKLYKVSTVLASADQLDRSIGGLKLKPSPGSMITG